MRTRERPFLEADTFGEDSQDNCRPIQGDFPVGRRVFPRLRFIIMAAMVVVGGYFVARWVESIGGPAKFRSEFGLLAPAITLPLHAIVSISPFPSDVLCVANGALYGFWLGAALSWLGWWVAGLAEYGFGYQARRDFNLAARWERLPRWLRKFPVGHPVFLIGVRQVPGIGGHMATLLPGAAGVPFLRHVWCSAIAIVPGALLMSAIGVGLLRL